MLQRRSLDAVKLVNTESIVLKPVKGRTCLVVLGGHVHRRVSFCLGPNMQVCSILLHHLHHVRVGIKGCEKEGCVAHLVRLGGIKPVLEDSPAFQLCLLVTQLTCCCCCVNAATAIITLVCPVNILRKRHIDQDFAAFVVELVCGDREQGVQLCVVKLCNVILAPYELS